MKARIVAAVVVAVVLVGILAAYRIFVAGESTNGKYQEVLFVHPACSAVAIRWDVMLTVSHCGVNKGDPVYAATHGTDTRHLVGYARSQVAICPDRLQLWTIDLKSGQTLSPATLDDSRIAVDATTRFVGFGAPRGGKQRSVDGTVDATCGNACAGSAMWEASITGKGAVCSGDSGGAAFVPASGSKLAGIIEGGRDAWNNCARKVIAHHVTSDTVAWINAALADHDAGRGTQKTCP